MYSEKIIDLKTDSYQELCEQYAEYLTKKAELAAWEKENKSKLIEAAGGNRMEFGIKIEHIEAAGSVDYKKVIAELCSDEIKIDYLCEKHRKSPVKKVLIRKY